MNIAESQEELLKWAAETCKDNRAGIIKMLLGNLKVTGIKAVLSICSKLIKRKKFSSQPTTENLGDDEDAWFEITGIESIINWSGYTSETQLIGFIKRLLLVFRENEVRAVRASYTYHARVEITQPERSVSRRKSVPDPVGWWSGFPEEDILAVDCEMVFKIVGRKSNGKPRCKQVAGTVSVVSFHGKVVYKKIVKHAPKDVYLTDKAKKITGFTEYSFVNGTELATVKNELTELFNKPTKKLLILINAGSDFGALDLEIGDFEVFDLHKHYKKDTGPIGLRSLVNHFYGIDIQKGIHDPDTDAKFTMKIFKEQYISDKLAHPDDSFSKETERKFNNIVTLK